MLFSFWQFFTTPLALILAAIPIYWSVFFIRESFTKENRRWSFFAILMILFVSFFMIRLWSGLPPINIYDDEDYMAHATSLSFCQFPSYEKEFIRGQGRFQPIGSPGIAIMAFPFTLIGSIIDNLTDANLVQQRVANNTYETEIHFTFILASITIFTLTVLLWIFFLKDLVGRYSIFMAVFGGVFILGLAVFTWRRPLFTHDYEFFLQSLWVIITFKCYKLNSKEFKAPNLLFVVSLGLLSALTVLTRVNNLFYALIWPILIFGFGWGSYQKGLRNFFKTLISGLQKVGWWRLALVYLIATFCVFWFLSLPDYYNPPAINNGYSGGYLENFKKLSDHIYNPWNYLKRLFYIFTGPDMGLIYTAPSILIGLWAFWGMRKKLQHLCPWLFWTLWVSVPNFILVMLWGSYGSSYGYRYFVHSLAPLVIIPLALQFQKWYNLKKYLFLGMATLSFVWAFLSQLFFHAVIRYKAVPDWFGKAQTMGNQYFQMELLDLILFRFNEFWAGFIKSPLLFIQLPYQAFINFEGNYRTELRYLIIFLFPLILWFFLTKGKSKTGLHKIDIFTK